jgi:hypothetical protein
LANSGFIISIKIINPKPEDAHTPEERKEEKLLVE